MAVMMQNRITLKIQDAHLNLVYEHQLMMSDGRRYGRIEPEIEDGGPGRAFFRQTFGANCVLYAGPAPPTAADGYDADMEE